MTPRRRRMIVVGLILVGVSLATFLALTAFQKNLLYFYTPSQVAAGEAPKGYPSGSADWWLRAVCSANPIA